MDLVQTCLGDPEELRHDSAHPHVTLTYAQSLDGCIAARRGSRLSISGQESKAFTHQLRAAHEAILVGIGTVLADNPRLSVRLAPGNDPQPVILDSRLRIPLDARLLSSGRIPPWIVSLPGSDPEKRSRLEAAGARLLEIAPDPSGRLSLPILLTHLKASEINSLMVEGGARVITSFLTERLVDRIVLTIAPFFAGGLHAVEGPIELEFEENGPRFQNAGFVHRLPRLAEWGSIRLGKDLILWGSPVWED